MNRSESANHGLIYSRLGGKCFFCECRCLIEARNVANDISKSNIVVRKIRAHISNIFPAVGINRAIYVGLPFDEPTLQR